MGRGQQYEGLGSVSGERQAGRGYVISEWRVASRMRVWEGRGSMSGEGPSLHAYTHTLCSYLAIMLSVHLHLYIADLHSIVNIQRVL